MLALILAAALAQAESGPPSAPPEWSITRPVWLRRPDAEDIARVYPDRAKEENLVGKVILDCEITPAGLLGDCKVSDDGVEVPLFSDAGLKLSKLFKLRATDADGRHMEGHRISIPIGFWIVAEAKLGPVTAAYAGVAAHANVNCRAKRNGQFDNCLVQDAKPYSREIASAAEAAAARVSVQKGPPSAERVLVTVELVPRKGD